MRVNKKNLYVKQNKLHSSQLCAARQMTRDVLLLSLYLRRMWLQGQCCLILAAGRRLETECKRNLYPKVSVTRANGLTLFLKEKKIFLIYITKFAHEFTYSDFDTHLVPWETKECVKN